MYKSVKFGISENSIDKRLSGYWTSNPLIKLKYCIFVKNAKRNRISCGKKISLQPISRKSRNNFNKPGGNRIHRKFCGWLFKTPGHRTHIFKRTRIDNLQRELKKIWKFHKPHLGIYRKHFSPRRMEWSRWGELKLFFFLFFLSFFFKGCGIKKNDWLQIQWNPIF